MTGGGGATYARNGSGQRVAKTVGGVTTVFFYDGAGRLLGEYTSSGTTIQEYVYLGNMPVAIVQPTSTYYVKADELNTPRAVVDTAGTTVWSWARLPFGENAPSGAFTLNLRFPGQYYDAETGTMENHMRVYDPKLGRYLQSDPAGLHGGLNTYAYVKNNPLQRVDPSGLLDNSETALETKNVLWESPDGKSALMLAGAITPAEKGSFGPVSYAVSGNIFGGQTYQVSLGFIQYQYITGHDAGNVPGSGFCLGVGRTQKLPIPGFEVVFGGAARVIHLNETLCNKVIDGKPMACEIMQLNQNGPAIYIGGKEFKLKPGPKGGISLNLIRYFDPNESDGLPPDMLLGP